MRLYSLDLIIVTRFRPVISAPRLSLSLSLSLPLSLSLSLSLPLSLSLSLSLPPSLFDLIINVAYTIFLPARQKIQLSWSAAGSESGTFG